MSKKRRRHSDIIYKLNTFSGKYRRYISFHRRPPFEPYHSVVAMDESNGITGRYDRCEYCCFNELKKSIDPGGALSMGTYFIDFYFVQYRSRVAHELWSFADPVVPLLPVPPVTYRLVRDGLPTQPWCSVCVPCCNSSWCGVPVGSLLLLSQQLY